MKFLNSAIPFNDIIACYVLKFTGLDIIRLKKGIWQVFYYGIYPRHLTLWTSIFSVKKSKSMDFSQSQLIGSGPSWQEGPKVLRWEAAFSPKKCWTQRYHKGGGVISPLTFVLYVSDLNLWLKWSTAKTNADSQSKNYFTTISHL